MNYFIETKEGRLTKDDGSLLSFKTHAEARNCAIDHCNFSDIKLTIANVTLHNEMKEWLLDCFQTENEQEEINELSHKELLEAVERYYDGGMKAFRECNGWASLEATL